MLNRNKTKNNLKRKNLSLNKEFHDNKNFKSIEIINYNNRFSADSNNIRMFKFLSKNKIKIDCKEIKCQTPTPSHFNHSVEIKYNNLNQNLFFLNKNKFINNTNYKINNLRKSQTNRIKLFRNNSLKELYFSVQNEPFYLMNDEKSNDINKINSNNLYKRVLSNSSQNYFFKIKNINKIIIKRTMLNKRIIPSFSPRKKNSSNYCDASTNTYYEKKNSLIENKTINLYNKPKRPLMIDYFESEHKKFYHGFDKFKGKNKYKIPFFIVYKY